MYLLIRLSLFLLLLFPYNTYAATHVADSCSDTHVQAAIDAAIDGDTVTIPSGNCTWDDQVKISNKGITLQGAGEGVTTITCDRSGSPCLYIKDASSTSIGDFSWTQPDYDYWSGSIEITGDTLDWRIHDITLIDQSGERFISIFKNAYRGLIDHCTMTISYTGIHIRLNNYKGSSKGEEFWLEDIDWGGPDWIFIEDNTFHRKGHGSYLWSAVDCDGPGKYVFRENTCINTKVINHGYDYNGCYRGSRGIDVYNNTFEVNSEDGIEIYRAGYVMGGTAMVHDNVYSTDYTYAFGPYAPRVGYAYGGCNSHTCDGTQIEDGNTGGGNNPGYPCRDQPGQGLDSGASLGAGEPWDGCFLEDQALEPIYGWNNTWEGGADANIDAPYVYTGNRYYVAENRDYYNYDSTDTPWAGTDGVGVGTQAARPATCTTGVAYWDTTNSQLDKCTATNTWTEGVYETYTYPHPLIGTEPLAPQPNPMTWATEPAGATTTTISMTGSTCTDATTPIDYTFNYDPDSDDCGTDADIGTGGTDSGAQESDTTYTDETLQTNQAYCYACTATDSYGTPQTNTASSTVTVYTLAATPTATTYENEGDTTAEILALGANGNPAATPETTFALQMVTCTPADTDWQDKWIQSDGSAGASEAWMSATTINALTISGLETATTYGIKAKAINGDSIETALGSEGQFATTGAYVSPPLAGVKGLRITGMSTR